MAGYIVLKEKQIINKKYFSYLLHRYDVAYMKLLGSGVRQTINYGHISDSILFIPPLSNNKKIAQFLDDKTAKIDRAVDLAEKQIALLKEHKADSDSKCRNPWPKPRCTVKRFRCGMDRASAGALGY